MDLRDYTVPNNIEEIIKNQSKEGLTWYQPFIFSEDVITGTGAMWNANQKSYFCTTSDSSSTKVAFLREALCLGNWYNTLNKIAIEVCPSAMNFLDIGGNVGHFGFDLTAQGKKVTVVDRAVRSYQVVNAITGIEFEYIPDMYSEKSHEVVGLRERKFDFTIASAVSTHLSDPHYFLGYLGTLTAKGMLLTTPVSTHEGSAFFARIPIYRRYKPLPYTFELVPTKDLAENLLRLAGFEYIYRRLFKKGDPKNTQAWGVWFALKEPAPEEAVTLHELVLQPDKLSKYADRKVAGTPLSCPPKWK